MAKWGTQKFQGNTQPNWFVDITSDDTGAGTDDLGHLARGFPANNVIYTRPNHPAAAENLEATDRGWERVVRYTDSAGNLRTKREVVVANRGLANTLDYGTTTDAQPGVGGGPEIVDIRWGEANSGTTSALNEFTYDVGAGTVSVVVTYSEPVLLTESSPGGRAKVNIAGTTTKGGASDTFLDAVCISGNGTNKLVFSNTCTLAASDVLTLEDSKTFIALTSATLLGLRDTMRGRGANTETAGTRPANVSSYGVFGLSSASTVGGYAGQTLAVDAGRKLVKEA